MMSDIKNAAIYFLNKTVYGKIGFLTDDRKRFHDLQCLQNAFWTMEELITLFYCIMEAVMFLTLTSLWNPRTQQEMATWIDAEADALIRDFGVGAYAAARKKVRDAGDLSTMRYWGAVKDAVAQGTSIAKTISGHAQLCETVAPIEPRKSTAQPHEELEVENSHNPELYFRWRPGRYEHVLMLLKDVDIGASGPSWVTWHESHSQSPASVRETRTPAGTVTENAAEVSAA